MKVSLRAINSVAESQKAYKSNAGTLGTMSISFELVQSGPALLMRSVGRVQPETRNCRIR